MQIRETIEFICGNHDTVGLGWSLAINMTYSQFERLLWQNRFILFPYYAFYLLQVNIAQSVALLGGNGKEHNAPFDRGNPIVFFIYRKWK